MMISKLFIIEFSLFLLFQLLYFLIPEFFLLLQKLFIAFKLSLMFLLFEPQFHLSLYFGKFLLLSFTSEFILSLLYSFLKFTFLLFMPASNLVDFDFMFEEVLYLIDLSFSHRLNLTPLSLDHSGRHTPLLRGCLLGRSCLAEHVGAFIDATF